MPKSGLMPAPALERTPAPYDQPPSLLPFFRDDAARYVWMIREVDRRTKDRPFARDTAFRNCGALAFGISVDELLSAEAGARKPHLMVPRQKLICATRLLTGATWHRLGFVFQRDHSTIINNYNRAFDDVAPILRKLA